jgi:hypothetical protein
MDQDFLTVKTENQNPKAGPPGGTFEGEKVEQPKEGMSAESILTIVSLILLFIALNVWGYYFYKRGFFGVGADINKSPTPNASTDADKKDSIYMLPNIN